MSRYVSPSPHRTVSLPYIEPIGPGQRRLPTILLASARGTSTKLFSADSVSADADYDNGTTV